MAAFALAHLRTPQLHADVLEYLEQIQATLDPFGGRFLVHGGAVEVREGSWPGTLVLIEFPTVEAARDWYASPAYQRILPLRTRHIEGDALLVEGVRPDHDSAQMAARLRALLSAAPSEARAG